MAKQHTPGHRRETHLGRMLSLYRTANGWTVREMAKIVGTSPATLSRLERNYAMDADTLLTLLNWLLQRSAPPGRGSERE